MPETAQAVGRTMTTANNLPLSSEFTGVNVAAAQLHGGRSAGCRPGPLSSST